MDSNQNLPLRPAESRKTVVSKIERRQTAQYISEMALELRNLAKNHGFVSLQGLLEVAYYEAFTAATENEIPSGEQERLEQMSKAAAG